MIARGPGGPYNSQVCARAFKSSIQVRNVFLFKVINVIQSRAVSDSLLLLNYLGHINSIDSSIGTVYYADVTQY